MKKFLTFLFLIVSMITNAQTWQWAKSAGGISNDIGIDIATDPSGNVYVTGFFQNPSITFDSITLLGSGGFTYSDIFIVKYDYNGNVLWAKSAGGSNEDTPAGLATDAIGNVYLTGKFCSSSITFDSITLTKSPNGSAPDMFVVKYDTNGNVLWAKREGGPSHDEGRGIAVDGSGNVYITGEFWNSSITIDSTILYNSGVHDIFIVKYDTNGNVVWAKGEGGTSADIGLNVAVDGNGNVYVTGVFKSSSIVFDSIAIINSGFYTYDVFTVKYDTNGNVLWAKSGGGTETENSNSIATDGSGNVNVIGRFNSSSINFGSTSLINAGPNLNYDCFILQYDINGNILWANRAGGTQYDMGWGNAIDGSGNLFITGRFSSSSITFGSHVLTNAGIGNDIFILNYDSNGNILWAISAGSSDSEDVQSIAADEMGNLYITGSYESSSLPFDSTILINGGSHDFFMAKLNFVTGVDESTFSDGIQVFPNPSNETFTISGLSMNTSVSVYNLVGEIISSSIASSSTETFTLNASDGVYFIHVKSGTQQAVKKIVVNRW